VTSRGRGPGRILVFLSHTGADKPVVSRFCDALSEHKGIIPWLDERQLLAGDDLLGITKEVVRSDHVIVFWSKHALRKHKSGRGVANLSWVGLEIRTALEELRRRNRKFALVRLDDAAWPTELKAVFEYRLYVDARGALDATRADRDMIIWRAVNAIVGSLRGRPPIYPTLELLKLEDIASPGTIHIFFTHSWVMGHRGGGDAWRDDYIESSFLVDPSSGHRVPAKQYPDGVADFAEDILAIDQLKRPSPKAAKGKAEPFKLFRLMVGHHPDDVCGTELTGRGASPGH
jgi:hypothetical protein